MFDKKQVYETELQGAAERLARMCYERGLPCFISVAVADDGNRTEYRNEAVSPDKAHAELSDDQISRHINVCNGFHTKLPAGPVVWEM